MDEVTEAFNQVLAAWRLPAGTEHEKTERHLAVQAATRLAMEVPFKVIQEALASLDVLAAMAADGLPSSTSDAGVGALCARAAVRGAFLNVRINAAGMEDKAFVDDLLARGRKMEEQAAEREAEILAVVQARM